IPLSPPFPPRSRAASFGRPRPDPRSCGVTCRACPHDRWAWPSPSVSRSPLLPARHLPRLLRRHHPPTAGRGGVATRAEPTPAIVELLESIRESDTDQLAVSEADGRFLRTLVLATGAQRVLEIGGASGYSAIWMGLGLRETGGSLVTIEYD